MPLRLDILRAVDKMDRLGFAAVLHLLTTGRMDASGDFTPGCGLTAKQAIFIVSGVARDTRVRAVLDEAWGKVRDCDWNEHCDVEIRYPYRS